MVLKSRTRNFGLIFASQHFYNVAVYEKQISQFRARIDTILFPRNHYKVGKTGKAHFSMVQASEAN